MNKNLLSVITHHPFIISPDQNILDAIAMMDETGCSYVLVGNEKYDQDMGIITERDIIHINAQGMLLKQLRVQSVMRPIFPIQISELTDINSFLTLFQKQQIPYLVVLEGDRLVGVIEKENLLELFIPPQVHLAINYDQIGDRQTEDAKFWASEQRSQKLFDALPKISVQGYRSDRQVIYWNKASEKIYGHTSEEALGQKLENLIIPPPMRQDVINLVEAWVNGGEPIPASELTLMAKDGSSVYVYSSHVLLNNSRNEPELYCIDIDLSEHRQAEAALKQSEAQSRAILAAIPDLMFRVGADGIYRGFVQNRDFGILPADADLTGQSIADLMSEEITNQQFYYMQKALQTGDLQIYEQQIQVGDHLQDEEVRVIKIEDDEVLFMIRDISDRKQAESALKQSEMTNRTIIETLPDLLIQMDIEGRYIRMFAGGGVRVVSPSNLPDQIEINNFLPADLAEQRLHYAKQAISTGSLQIYEQILTIEDEQRYEEVRIAPLNDREVLIIIRDITDAKQVEFERSLNEELIRATRLKDEFLANMSHELRTPLNAILGMTEGLQEQVFGNVNDRQIKALQTIERSGSHLLELINDILDVAKIESGQIKLDFVSTAITHLCNSSLAFIKQQAHKKQVQIEIILSSNLPDLVMDERRMRQVLINLLNNAVKFTPNGGRITLKVSRQKLIIQKTATSPESSPKVRIFANLQAPEQEIEPQSGDLDVQDCLRIEIADTGIGIAPENISKLFQPFIQIDSALNRQYSGTGLGLTIAKRIVELHGGKIGLASELGVGSCFIIDLPYPISPTSSPKSPPPPEHIAPIQSISPEIRPEINRDRHQPIKPPLILLAEDNEANISTFSSYLKAKGYRLMVANNGEEAIALAKAHTPDIILMDIQMPKLDGLETTKQIRLDPNLANIPIIALTALVMSGDQERCLAAGANDYLSKPVKLKQLVSMIQTVLEVS